MSTGWIKLWDETIYNHVWRDDPVAWKIFEYLLISAYKGQPQGTSVKTLQQITDVCGGKNGTNYKAIKRLEKLDMVKTKSTNRSTTFKIVNWWKYQGNGSNGKNEVKTKEKPSNTLYKNKDIRIKKNIDKSVSNETRQVYELFLKEFGKSEERYKLTPKRKAWIRSRLKDAGLPMIEEAVRRVAASPFHRGDNDRGWSADLDFIVRNYEQVEKLSQLEVVNEKSEDLTDEQRKAIMERLSYATR